VVAAAQRLVLWSELVLARLLRAKGGAPAVRTTGGMVIVTITAAVADGTASRIGTVGNLGDLIRIKAPLAVLPRGPEPGMLMGSLPKRGSLILICLTGPRFCSRRRQAPSVRLAFFPTEPGHIQSWKENECQNSGDQ